MAPERAHGAAGLGDHDVEGRLGLAEDEAHPDATGTTCNCDDGFYISNGACAPLPTHAHLTSGYGYECDAGYTRQTDGSCLKDATPGGGTTTPGAAPASTSSVWPWIFGLGALGIAGTVAIKSVGNRRRPANA